MDVRGNWRFLGWCEWDWEAVGGRWMSDAMGGNGWM